MLNFQKIINDIDTIRESKGRIKKTRNNIKSSRSIMIFDFKIKIKETGNYEDDYVNFVIIDLPGKENIKETNGSNDIVDLILLIIVGLIVILVMNSIFNIGKSIGLRNRTI
jgi:hypothetical protein